MIENPQQLNKKLLALKIYLTISTGGYIISSVVFASITYNIKT